MFGSISGSEATGERHWMEQPTAAHSAATRRVVVIGAGPAGLTAAYELAARGWPAIVLEKGARVGGLARTEQYHGFHFDMGGHRFFTKVEEVHALWRAMLGPDFLRRPRLSRIYYDGKFFHYPLKPGNALGGLGVRESVLVVLSYLRWQLMPYGREDTFEQWVTNRFGRRLFRTFFKTYTEKVWGISCAELKAEWAAQRIKDLSLRAAVLDMFVKARAPIKSLIEEFDYPRLGPGMMWAAVRDAVERRGGTVHLDCDVVRVRRDGRRITGVVVAHGGSEEVVAGTDFVSSMPLSELIARLDPPVDPEVRAAAAKLTYRDFLTVCLIVDRPELFPDNWIYVHDPSVRVGRIQNFKNWSPDMVPDPRKTSLGLEYFCSDGDELWTMPDAELIELGRREIARIGLARPEEIEDGCVVRLPKAYPVYDTAYREVLDVVRRFVDGLENLQTIGRNGLHRYNNQDHAMLTGMLAVRNLVLGERNDLWSVNTEPEYHEEIRTGAERAGAPLPDAIEGALARVFAKLDRVAFGLALGSATGIVLALVTLLIALRDGTVIRPYLQLLAQYFPGYRVSPMGSVLGLGYGALAGFAAGWTFAFVRNATMFLSIVAVHRRAEARLLRRLLDYV
jgi:protoporphyrinogen oxidase